MRQFVKRNDASDLVLMVMVWGVLSVLVTRAYLKIANNPVIGFGQWHLAHVLWGGMFMFIAMILILVFEGKRVRKYVAVLGGIGWGFFIDEVGKYVTSDNNYWFRPAIIFIYISFICLFLLYRYLEKTEAKTNKSLFYAVLNRTEEIVEDDLEIKEKKFLQNNLKKLIQSEKPGNLKIISQGMLGVMEKIKAKDNNKRDLKLFVKEIFNISYNKVFKRALFTYGLWAFSVYYALDKLIDIATIVMSSQKMAMIQKFYEDYDFFGKADLYMIVFKMVFEVIAAILFLLGARYFWSKKRIRGIRFFKYGLYVSIFFVSIFRFYFEQFQAVYEVLISMILLEILNQHQREIVINSGKLH